MFELFIFFSLLSFAYAIEMSVSITRIVGLKNYDLGAAITLQSALALISRLAVFIYMPLAGFIVDFSSELLSLMVIIVPFSIVPILIVISALNSRHVTRLVGTLIQRAITTGSYFSTAPEKNRVGFVEINIFNDSYSFDEVKRITNLNVLVILFSYVLYYVSWPVIFLSIHLFPDARTTIFASAALFTGLNTLCMSLIADPTTLKLSAESSAKCELYLNLLIRLRVYGSLIALISLIIFGTLFYE